VSSAAAGNSSRRVPLSLEASELNKRLNGRLEASRLNKRLEASRLNKRLEASRLNLTKKVMAGVEPALHTEVPTTLVYSSLHIAA
jgi:hypothetical protein